MKESKICVFLVRKRKSSHISCPYAQMAGGHLLGQNSPLQDNGQLEGELSVDQQCLGFGALMWLPLGTSDSSILKCTV